VGGFRLRRLLFIIGMHIFVFGIEIIGFIDFVNFSGHLKLLIPQKMNNILIFL